MKKGFFINHKKGVLNAVVLLTFFLLLILCAINSGFGFVCGDGCHVEIRSIPLLSYLVYALVYLLIFYIVWLNIRWYNLYKKEFKRPKLCLIYIICNCLFCLYNAILLINGWLFFIVIFPQVITFPIQVVLWFYVLFGEIIKTKSALILALIIGIPFLLLVFGRALLEMFEFIVRIAF